MTEKGEIYSQSVADNPICAVCHKEIKVDSPEKDGPRFLACVMSQHHRVYMIDRHRYIICESCDKEGWKPTDWYNLKYADPFWLLHLFECNGKKTNDCVTSEDTEIMGNFYIRK